MKTKANLFAAGILLTTLANGFAQPVITMQPQSQTNVVGSTLTLAIEAMGIEPLSYQWRKSSVPVPGATNATLVFTNLQSSNAGNYTVVVTNIEGAVTSSVAFVRVLVPPSISAQPTNFLTLSLGASVSNRVTASGTTPLFYQWRLNGTNLPGQTNALIVLTNLQMTHVGDYTVVVNNVAGSTNSQVARLNVDPTFTKITTGPIVTTLATTSGLTWGDFDNDGFLDLFVPNTEFPPPNVGVNSLYRNRGNGTFSVVTNAGLRAQRRNSLVGVWGDYDNDGFLDLFVTDGGQVCSLYRNQGNGTFTTVTNGGHVTIVGAYDGAAWGDFDRDGFIDLFISTTSVVQGTLSSSFLYRNNGDTFTRVTSGNVATDLGNARSCAWGDFDDDGRLDLFVPNAYFITNFLYQNTGGGSFARVTSGIVATELADSRGCGWGDYDNDGYMDLFVANGGRTSTQSSFLYHNNGDGTFTKVTSGSIVNDGGHSLGCVWGDYDNDGFLDMFVANIGGENNFLYHNNGDGSFTKITTGSPVNDGGESWGCAWGDYDNDGFLDLVVGNGGNPLVANPPDSRNFLYRNNGNSNSWITVKLVGTISNRSAIGAKVRVKAFFAGEMRWQLRQISGAEGYGGQNGLRAHFGLGDATIINTVRIEWPSGTVQELHNVAAKQLLTITEPPRLAALQVVTNGPFQMQLTCWPGFDFAIETSTNLIDWTPWMTVTTTNRLTRIDDPAGTAGAQQFYRARHP